MDPLSPKRKLAAILAADVAGYSRLMAADSVLAEFASGLDAGGCAETVHRAMVRN